MRTVYLNGEYVPESQAKVSVFDRGFLFGDAVYEVTAVLDGQLVDFEEHMMRLSRSLLELDMQLDLSIHQLRQIHIDLVLKNQLREGVIYLQICRGVAERDFIFKPKMGPQTIVLFTQEKNLVANPLASRGLKVITLPDQRWGRRDIKTTQLLYSSLVKSRAVAAGADDVWLEQEGKITEGTSSNAFIVANGKTIITRPLSNDILHGITRKIILECAHRMGLQFEERPFTVAEAEEATEAFSTSASGFLQPVVSINGMALGNGAPGELSQKLRSVYIERARARSAARAV